MYVYLVTNIINKHVTTYPKNTRDLNKSTNIFIIRITPYYSNLNPYLVV